MSRGQSHRKPSRCVERILCKWSTEPWVSTCICSWHCYRMTSATVLMLAVFPDLSNPYWHLRWSSDIRAFLPGQHLDQAFMCVMVSNLLTNPLSWVILALSFKIRKQIWCGYIYGCLVAGRSLIAVCKFVRASSHDPTAVPMLPSVKVRGCIRSVELHWLSIPWCSWLCSMWLQAFWL